MRTFFRNIFCVILLTFLVPQANASESVQVVNCSAFGNFTIRNNVVTSSLQCAGDISVPDNVVSIGSQAFLNASNLTSVIFGKNVATIGGSAFYKGASQFVSLTFPDATVLIDDFAFSYATSLTTLTIGKNVSSIGKGAFFGASKLTSLIIPDSVVSIGNQAFLSATSLTTVDVGSGVTSIGLGAFADLRSLNGFIVSESNSKYSSDAQGVLYNKDKSILIQAPLNKSNIIIPETVVLISDGAFTNSRALPTLVIPKSVAVPGVRLLEEIKEAIFRVNAEKALSEKSQQGVGSKSTVTTPVSKKTTIICVRGKIVKKITAVKPKCPAGYSKK